MSRYKREDLEALLESLNAKLRPSAQLELDHAACYGGYCLVYKEETGHHSTPRMPIRGIYQYLQGALDYVTPDN